MELFNNLQGIFGSTGDQVIDSILVFVWLTMTMLGFIKGMFYLMGGKK